MYLIKTHTSSWKNSVKKVSTKLWLKESELSKRRIVSAGLEFYANLRICHLFDKSKHWNWNKYFQHKAALKAILAYHITIFGLPAVDRSNSFM